MRSGRMEIKEKGKGFIREFKEFSMKGNVIDLAVGVIIGGAFNKIVSSIVNDIIMPVIGIFLGGVNFETLSYVLKPAMNGKEAVVLKYGSFIQNIVDFLIIAFSVFIFVKGINKINLKNKEKNVSVSSETSKPTREEELLTEIRDTLREISNKNI